MFKRDVQSVKDLILRNLREQGLETPLQQKRLVEAWPQIAGPLVERYTLNTYIYNQVLFVRLSSPALRAELSMRRQELVTQLNQHVGSQVITDIRFCWYKMKRDLPHGRSLILTKQILYLVADLCGYMAK